MGNVIDNVVEQSENGLQNPIIETDTNNSYQDVIFIDSAIQDYQNLITNDIDNAKVIHISPQADGIVQIAQHLKGTDNLNAIHIISHGQQGQIQLGNSNLNTRNIDDYQEILNQIGDHLKSNGDILLYGCNVGQGQTGQQFVNALADMTDADIASSEDITSNENLGGDWDLEFNVGQIEADVFAANETYSYALAIYNVTNTNDSGAGSLRQAIIDANAAGGIDTINIDAGIQDQTITLTTGKITINDDTVIHGDINVDGNFNITLDGNANSGIFLIDGGASVQIDGVHFTNGSTIAKGGAININNASDLTLVDCYLTDNFADQGGGAIIVLNASDITIQESVIANNTATGTGGGIQFRNGSTGQIENTIISGNLAGDGGGIGLKNDGNVVTVAHSTITNNRSENTAGGGIDRDAADATSTLNITHSIVAGNFEGNVEPYDAGDIGFNIQAGSGYNLIGDTATAGALVNGVDGNIVGGNADLIQNTDAAGRVIFYLGALSDAIDGGDAGIAGEPTVDIHGQDRKVDTIDIGALEMQKFYVTNTNDTGGGTFKQAVIDANAQAGMELIEFNAGLLGQSFTFSSGKLTLTDDVVIDGDINNDGNFDITIDNNGGTQAFIIDGNYTAMINGIRMTECYGNDGGAIEVKNGGHLILANGWIDNCTAGGNGGGIYVNNSSAKIIGTVFSDSNNNNLYGAAIGMSFATVEIENSLFTGNVGAIGGAIGMRDGGNTLIISHSTLKNNRSKNASHGAIAIDNIANGTLTLTHSIIANNKTGTITPYGTKDLSFNVEAGSDYNLIGDAGSAGGLTDGASGNIVGGTPWFVNSVDTAGRPAAYLGPASDALNAGNPGLNNDETDGMGQERVFGIIDIGAVEMQANTLPFSSNKTISMDANTVHTFAAGNFTFTDIDGDAFDAIKITGLETAGELKLSGGAVPLDQEVLIANIANLTFTPVADQNGAGYATFKFRVSDGTDLSFSEYTMTINVDMVNTDPVINNVDGNSYIYLNTNEKVFPTYQGTVTDANLTDFNNGVLTISYNAGADGNNLLTIANDDHVTLQGNDVKYDGVNVGVLTAFGGGTNDLAITFDADADVAEVQAILRRIAFSNSSATLPTTDIELEFTLTDGDGGTSLASVVTIDMGGIHDVPAGQNTDRNNDLVFSAGNGNLISVKANDLNKKITTTLTATNGEITLSGFAGLTFGVGDGTDDATCTFTATVTEINAALDGLIFSPTTGFDGAANIEISTAGASALDSDVNLVSQYTFENSGSPYNDDWGPNDGNANGPVISYDQDRGAVATFDGVDDRITLTGYKGIGGTNARSLSFWLKTGTFTELTPTVMAWGADAAGQRWSIIVKDNKLRLSGEGGNVNGTAIVDDNTWHHVVMTWADDGTPTLDDAIFYVDGVLDGHTADATAINTGNNQDVLIGDGFNDAQRAFAGSLDDVRIYDRVLTPAEIAMMVNGYDGSFADTDNIAITVNPGLNDAPTSADNTLTVIEDNTLTFAAGNFNFADTDGDALTQIQITSLETAGVLKLSGGDVVLNQVITLANITNLVFTPAANTNGPGYATFQFKVHDGTEYSAIAYTMSIDVTPVQDVPVASDDNIYSTDEDVAINISAANGVLDNDTDVENDALTAILVTNPAYGNLTFNPDGSFIYSPQQYWYGTDTFTYKANDGNADSNLATVTITVSPVNNAPIANDDSDYMATEDSTLKVNLSQNLLLNDTDIENDALAAILVKTTSHGKLNLNSDGTFDYKPSYNWSGIDTFNYMVNDGNDNSNVATVTITVSGTNDAPRSSADSYNTTEDNVLDITSHSGVLANDSDPDGDSLNAQLVSGTSNGQLLLNTDGSFSYKPDFNWNGIDSFTYKTNDGRASSDLVKVSINVAAINDWPVNSVPGPQNTAHDTPVIFSNANMNSISVSDIDAQELQVTLQIQNGKVTLTNTDGIRIIHGDGNLDNSLTIAGNQDSINSAIDNIIFFPDEGFSGQANLTITTDDLGNTGIGGVLTDSDTVFITVAQAPVTTSPPPTPTVVTPVIDNDSSGTSTTDNGLSNDNMNKILAPPINSSINNDMNDPASNVISGIRKKVKDENSVRSNEADLGIVADNNENISGEYLTEEAANESESQGIDKDSSKSSKFSSNDTNAFSNHESAHSKVSKNTDAGSSSNNSSVSNRKDKITLEKLINPDSRMYLIDRDTGVSVLDTSQFDYNTDGVIISSRISKKNLIFNEQQDYIDKQAEEQAKANGDIGMLTVGTVTTVSGVLSFGYLLWLIKGGSLLASVMSNLPLWQFVDPLPILDSTNSDSHGFKTSKETEIAEKRIESLLKGNPDTPQSKHRQRNK
ncbi:MAG: tandem-95 repeat protein [Phycisphaerae bacterium]|nr:tandem-95 repeat protein [Phycisphaerae bacterium]